MEVTSYGKNHFFAYPINDSIAVRRNNIWARFFGFSFRMILLSFVFFKSVVVLMGFKSLTE